jgi:outer membrane protein OmpA-like peptidoglycan-associated protein
MKIIVAALFIPAVVHADPKIEIGGTLGSHSFSHTTELGANDDNTDPGPASSGLIGARFAYVFLPRLAAEGELTIIPTKDDVIGDRAMVYGLGTHVRFDLLTGKVKPFVVAGFGANILRSASPQMRNDVDQAYHWGLGVRWAVSERIDLRLDGRQEIVPSRTHNGATSDFEFMLGVTYRIGQIEHPLPPPPPVIVPPAEPPPAPPPPPVIVPQPEPIAELAGIGFELDSAVVSIDSYAIMERAHEMLAKHPALTVEISGHTSSEGDADRNLKLSLARAEAVKAYLVGRGTEAARIQTVGHGSAVPVAENTTEEGRKKNRRIEFHILDGAGQ